MNLRNIFLGLLLTTGFVWGLSQEAAAQQKYSYFSAGVQASTSHYQGDLDDNGFDFWAAFESAPNRNNGNPFKLLRPGFGFSINYHFHPHFFVRLAFSQGWIGAADSFNKDPMRKWRNLSFQSHVTEISAQLVYMIIANDQHPRFRPNWSPYIFAGIGVFNFNPRAKPDAAWASQYPELFNPNQLYSLQPLGTEGQYLVDENDELPDPYALTQICIPIGIGVRRKINERFDVYFDIGLRKVFTDYLDDVSGTFYADPEELMRNLGPRSALFSDRSFYNGSAYDVQQYQMREEGKTDEKRGNYKLDDWYGFISLGATMIIGKQDRCPRLWNNRGRWFVQ